MVRSTLEETHMSRTLASLDAADLGDEPRSEIGRHDPAPRPPAPPADDDPDPSSVTRDHLLLHYVQAAPQTVASVDQLGNFLMGFGVLALGYLLQADLGAATGALHRAGLPLGLGVAALLAWSGAVVHLVLFVRTYVFEVLAGRRAHVEADDEAALGDVVEVPDDLAWRAFVRRQPTFERFLETSYRREDRASAQQLLYARFTYLRFMTLRKLAAMDRMRRLLGRALVLGVTFKAALVALGAT